MGKWKYFTDEEGFGMDVDHMNRLDHAREIVGFPIIRTSGLRTPEQNSNSGGVQNSSHLLGFASDLRSPTGKFEREKLIWALGLAGFRRIGIYDHHFHVDNDPNKSQDVAWFGVSHA